MKRMFSTTAIAASLLLLASLQNTASAQPRVGVDISYQTFYDELDPYGRWMDYPDYGYVWIPDCGPDFRPYSTNGHWVWSDDYEWMWVSDYDWGWAPFHYGRWNYDPYYGWMWIPGYEWSPAWVAWRDGGDYYGWAPLRPGINISIGFSLGGYNPPVDYWCFTERRYITSPRIYDYCAPRRNNITIINQTTIINNYNYNRNVFRTGPGRRDAERYAGRINSVRFRESSSPGRTGFRNNQVSMYRPNVQRGDSRFYSPRRLQTFDRNRNDNAGRRNDNNQPDRNNRGFDRRNDNRSDNGMADRRRNVFDRNDRTGNQPDRGNRIGNPDRPNRRFDQPNGNGNNDNRDARPDRPNRNRDNEVIGTPRDRRTFDRRSMDRTPGQNNGQQNEVIGTPRERRSMDRMPDQNNDRRMQRMERPDNDFNSNRREMRNQDRQPSQPRFEQRRQEQPQSQPRFEQRRQEQPQSQPRQFERRDNNGGGGNGDNGRHSGGGFGRRGR